MNFKINIKETLEKVVEIEADNVFDAIRQVQKKYDNSEIELTAEDMTDLEILNLED